MEKKYEFTGETMEWRGRTLHRIRALRHLKYTKKNELGGWIEDEKNLSHEGNCWVFDESKVYDDASVIGDAIVIKESEIFENADVKDKALVSKSIMFGKAAIFNHAGIRKSMVFGNVIIYNAVNLTHSKVSGFCSIGGKSVIKDSVIHGHATILGCPCVNKSEIYGFSEIDSEAYISNSSVYNSTLSNDVKVSGTVLNSVELKGSVRIRNCRLNKKSKVISIENIGSRNDITTFYIPDSGKIMVTCGCFVGTIEEFEEAVKNEHGDNTYGKQYMMTIEYVKNLLKLAKCIGAPSRWVPNFYNYWDYIGHPEKIARINWEYKGLMFNNNLKVGMPFIHQKNSF